MTAPLFLSLLHYFVCIIGTIANGTLLMVILTKSPTFLRSYAVLLFSQTAVQGITCVTSLLLFARLIPVELSLIVVGCGPVRLFRSYQWVHYLWSIMLHGHSHYCIMLAVCFSFRYYVILRESPRVIVSIIVVCIIYAPTVIVFILFSQAPILDPSDAREIVARKGPSYAFEDDEMVTGFASVLDPIALLGILWICTPCVPAYAIIVIVGRLMYRSLAANVAHMSEKTRASHKEIVRGLVFQACLPVLYSFSSGSYAICQFNLLNSQTIEYFVHMLGEACVSASPFLTFYFVQPYRRTISQIVHIKKQSSVVAAPSMK